MSKCVMIADKTIDEQKETITEKSVKDVVELILEEALVAAVFCSDKDCNQIGDFSVTEDFCQQFDQLPAYSKDFDANKLHSNQNNSVTNHDLNLESGESLERSVSLLTARENLELILDSLVKKEEKGTVFNECKIITEEILASNELRIENGQIHIEKKKSNYKEKGKLFDVEALVDSEKTDVAEGEKIEKECCGQENFMNKTTEFREILVNQNNGYEFSFLANEGQWKTMDSKGKIGDEDLESVKESCAPGSSEDLRQVFSGMFTDPKRPRAYAIAEEDVNKMAEEIQEINFNQKNVNLNGLSEVSTISFETTKKNDVDVIHSKSASAFSKEYIVQSNTFVGETSDVNTTSIAIEDQARDMIFPLNNGEKKKSSLDPNKFSPEGNHRNDLETSISREKVLEGKNNLKTTNYNINEINAINSDEKMNKIANENSPKCEINSKPRDENHQEKILPNFVNNKFQCSNLDGDLEFEPSKTENDAILFRNTYENDNENNTPQGNASERGQTTTTFVWGCPSVSSTDLENFQKDEGNIELFQISRPFTSIDGHVKKSQSGKEVETALSDSRLGLEKEARIFKASQSAHNAGKSSPDEQNSNSLVRIITANLNDGSFSLEKQVEVASFSSDESQNKSSGNTLGKVLSSVADSAVSVKASLLNKRGNEIVTSDVVNHIHCENSSEMFSRVTVENNSNFDKSHAKVKPNEECIEENAEIKTKPFTKEKDMGNDEKPNSSELSKGKRQTLHLPENKSRVLSTEHAVNSELSENQDCEIHSTSANDNIDETNASVPTSSACESCDEPRIKTPETNSEKNFISRNLAVTSSRENFVDKVESVIQVIDPADNSNDEESVTLSLLKDFEVNHHLELEEKSSTSEVRAIVDDNRSLPEPSPFPSAAGGSSEKKLRSGMTTIGPVKNADHDPKNLVCNVDYGRMTRVTSSKKLKKEDLLVMNVISKSSSINTERSDEDSCAAIEDDSLEMGSFVNRDIASLTKVQKIREVMSYLPKPDEDFKDDPNLSLSRLDLKDVESTTDERYKIPEVSISLMPFEMGSNDSAANMNIVQNVHLVINGNSFRDGNFYLTNDDSEEVNNERREDVRLTETYVEDSIHVSETDFNAKKSIEKIVGVDREMSDGKFERESLSSIRNHATLSNIFRKSTNKFICNEEGFFRRNSKSLPRDAGKLETSESLKTILNDCHSSAANMLKKSKTVLKSTQGIFKTLSQNRFGTFHGSFNDIESRNFSSLDTDVGTVEGKLSLLKKEDFFKVKNIIKGKVEKTLKAVESSMRRKSEIPIEMPNPRDEAKDEKGNVDDKNEIFELENEEENKKNGRKNSIKLEENRSSTKDEDERMVERWKKDDEDDKDDDSISDSKVKFDDEMMPNYIVMESVGGLPASDSEISLRSIQLEKSKPRLDVATIERNNHCDTSDTQIDEDGKTTETEGVDEPARESLPSPFKAFKSVVSEKKEKPKSKKLSAKIRSFWSSAFGKVKIQANKKGTA